ncbi:cysteine proteinase COT44-like [Magnolia sinica]|uniref:cysteine proteinase COT44-like n=1 Tax=Magnolia sinica TaxID=86752 RepID=UPI00265A37E1|nr:cysteine proteinase COT44-like [Magnolia sinica]
MHAYMTMVVLIFFAILCILCPTTSASDLRVTDDDVRSETDLFALYRKWLAIYHPDERSYGNGDDMLLKKFHVFKNNAMYIHASNKRSNVTYELGLNKFADLSNEEFRAIYTQQPQRVLGQQIEGGAKRNFIYGNTSEPLPATMDWRKKGAVTGVKDQGSCGSCWAFSTIAAVEGINQIKTGELVALSEQELVDCDKKINEGCNGGLMDYAFQFIVENGGISSERDYPYTATDNQCDLTKKKSGVVVIDGYEDVPVNSDDALMRAVAHQPVSVGIEAGGLEFQFYLNGVFTGTCGTNLDHGVSVVGYGTTNKGIKYWIVKNSWGSDWGEDGYIQMQRIEAGAKEGLCGINMMASYPLKSTTKCTPSKSNDPLIRQQPLGRKSGESYMS